MVSLDQIIEAAVSKGFFVDEVGGRYLRMSCPWHGDEHPSLLVYPDGWWKCMTEDTYGRNERLLEELENPGTIRKGRPQRANGHAPYLPTELDKLTGLAWRAHEEMRRNNDYLWYLQLRGIEDRVETAKLGWYEGWITVPIMSREQQLLGLYMRATPPQQKLTGTRFTQPDGQHPMIYCPDWRLWDSAKNVALVFGMMDALVLSSLRVPVITTTGGSKSFDPSWLDSWRKLVTIIPDREGDDEAALKLAAQLGWRGKILRLPYDEYDNISDPADFAKENTGKRKELRKLLAGSL